MRKTPKKLKYEEVPKDVKEHRKMKNDPKYVGKKKDIRRI